MGKTVARPGLRRAGRLVLKVSVGLSWPLITFYSWSRSPKIAFAMGCLEPKAKAPLL